MAGQMPFKNLVSLWPKEYFILRTFRSGTGTRRNLWKNDFSIFDWWEFFHGDRKIACSTNPLESNCYVYGVADDKSKMHIAAETSSFTKTINDPHVNLLRAGNEAFAAVVGGIQYLHVSPFDEITGSTSVSERIARNIQLLLKEEAHLKKVIDPAGGSWYVEDLTNNLAEKAWGFFQTIEAKGGILEVLKSSWLQQEIAKVYQKKNHDVQTRKKSIVGTNVYANLDEIVTYQKTQVKNSYFTQKEYSFVKVEGIPELRLSGPFEELRSKASYLEGKFGSKPTVGMICLGEFKAA